MKPEAFLPSNDSGLGSASSVPAVPIYTGPVGPQRLLPPKSALSLTQMIEEIDRFLYNNRQAPRAQRLELMERRHQLKLQQEAAELQANPAAAEDLRLIAERLAWKAQSGFSPLPLPASSEDAR